MSLIESERCERHAISSGGWEGALDRGSPVMTKRGRDVLDPDMLVDVTSMPGPSVDRALDTAFVLGSSHVLPNLPWEQNQFLKAVMGPPEVPWLKPVKTLRSVAFMPKIEKSSSDQSVVDKKVEKVRIAVYDKLNSDEDDKRVAELMKWSDLIMLCPERSTAGKMLLSCAEDEEMVLRSLKDIFARKATSTIKVRAGSLALYFKWLITKFPGDSLLPIQESRVYEYACWCRDQGCPASRIDTFIGTLRYVGGQLNFEGASEAAESARVAGASHQPFLGRAPRKRAEALRPVMLCWLEIACFALPDPFDRLVAGMCMLCCMGRFRCSDANRVRHAGLIGRFLVGSLSRTKNSRSKEKAAAFIPLVVPAFGLLGKPWLLEFRRARVELGLRSLPSIKSRAHDLTFVLVPQKASIDYDKQKAMTSVELTARLRGILAKGFPKEDLEGVTSHSLKTRLLAYVNIFGCDLTTSELLGYHVNKEHNWALNYTRDCLSAPIRFLVRMIMHVNVGAFKPMEARDEMFPRPLAWEALQKQFKAETGLDVADAAHVMQQDAVFFSREDRKEADRRFRTVIQEDTIPRCNMVTYLTEEEEMIIDCEGGDLGDSSESGDDSESESSSVDDECEAGFAVLEEYHRDVKGVLPNEKCDTLRAFRHSRTKMVHYGHVDFADKTGCGRLLSEAYTTVLVQ